MSVIGPRPLLVEYLPYYTKEEHHRHDVRPGLSGWAQINGRNAIDSWEQRFQYDLEYVKNVSFAFDTDIEKRVHAIADKLGIRDILSKFPYEVSGGQKQRCACARALINEPKLILADEPTGALDSKASRLLLETMSEINKKMQATILMVTHDPFSASFCERILFLKDGKIFNEIFRGEKSRKDFFNEILDILTLLGGEVGNVR